MTHSPTSAMLFGALVSDAACLGLHWLYDPDRIAEIAAAQGGACAFTPVDAAHYEGVPGYFAHAGRRTGMLTQYGEVLRLSIQCMNTDGGAFDLESNQVAFAAHFGPGGGYQGYIDRPTRGTLDNIAAQRSPTGVDDDQLPAIARLPAVLGGHHAQADVLQVVAQAVTLTNVNAVASAYGAAFADLLMQVMADAPLAQALESVVHSCDQAIQPELHDALTTTQEDSTTYAGEVGRACHLPTAGPVIIHILRHSRSYQEAVERNILAGGDSAGRSILIGAVMARVHGIATPTGIPMAWALKMENASELWQECAALGQGKA